MAYLEVLRDKRREVVAEIEKLRRESVDLAGLLAAKEGQLRNLDDLLALETGSEPRRPTGANGSPRLPAKSQRFTDSAAELLRSRGKPTHYQELARILAAQGVYVPGRDPAANLIAHMVRDGRFGRASGRGMYGLSSWPEVKAATVKRGVAPARVRRPRTDRATPVSRA